MNKHSRVCANIDLSAVMHNMEAMHQNIDPDTKIMAVIKADGYGHGAVPIAKVQVFLHLRWQKSFLLLPKKLEKTAGCILQWIPE